MYRHCCVFVFVLALAACSAGGAAPLTPLVVDGLSLAEQDATTAGGCDGCVSDSFYVLAAGTSVWRIEEHAVSQYDLGGKRLHSVAFDDVPVSFARAGNTLWVAAAATGEVTHVSNVERAGRLQSIDLTTGQPGAEIALDTARPLEVVVEGRFAWVAALEPTAGAPAERRLLQVDLDGKRLIGEHAYEVASLVRGQLAAGAGSVWLRQDGQLLRLDPITAEPLATIDVAAEALAFGANALWALGVYSSATGTQAVLRIDPASDQVAASIPVAGIGRQIRAGDAAVWVLSAGSDGKDLLAAIDPATNAVSATTQPAAQAVYIGIR